MKYVYFVSYAYKEGFGNCEVILSEKIESYTDVALITSKLSKSMGFEVCILNYQVLEKKSEKPKNVTYDLQ